MADPHADVTNARGRRFRTDAPPRRPRRVADLRAGRAALQRVENGWLVVDRASTHGTHVNGRRVEIAILRDGDELRLGLTARMIVRT